MTAALQRFREALRDCPLIAILRGVRPEEVAAIGDVLADAGFTLIEVPLNSPDPFTSIARLARRLSGRALVGAGTVLDTDDVRKVVDAGGTLLVSPNTCPPVIRAGVAAGLVCLPGYSRPAKHSQRSMRVLRR
jgi:2-dehydro-3-deoxyphosphogalactonate aldolase